MKIFIDPSELSSNSLMPQLPNSQPSPGLEDLTGCDFVVSNFPLPFSENTLQSHIQSGALFCQRKSGYDFIGNFEQAHREIARIQACKIPMHQAFILAIGKYYPDDNGLLRITGKRPLDNNKSLKYDTFLALEAEYRYSGVNVVKLNDENEIEIWINSQLREYQTIKDRNFKKELYPSTSTPITHPQDGVDYLQAVFEVPDDDIRYFLNSGLKGFGQKTANALVDYAKEHQGHLDAWGIYYIKILTDEDEKGKAIHNVPNWGDKSRAKFRKILGLPKGYNLSVREEALDGEQQFKSGWRMALIVMRQLIEQGKSSMEAYNQVLNNPGDFEF